MSRSHTSHVITRTSSAGRNSPDLRQPMISSGACAQVSLRWTRAPRVARAVAAWAAAPTATGALALLSLADFEGATVEVGGVQRLHGARGVGIRHLNEAETTRATRVTVDDQRHFLDGTVLGKQGAHGLVGRREWQISYI